jgi:tetratricopeptide (TPR) repeat protein
MGTNDLTPRRINVNRRAVPAQPPKGEVSVPRPAEGEPASGWTIRFLEGFVTFSLVALFFGLPLFFTGLTFQGLAFEKQIYFYFWIMLALIAWAVKGVILGEMKIRRTPLDIPIVIFWAAYLLATLFSVDKWHSFWGFFGDPSRGLMSVTAMIIGYYLVLSHFSEKRLVKIMAAFLVSGFLASAWVFLGVWGLKFLPAKIMSFAPLSPIGSLSGFGTFLAVLLPVAMVAIFKIGMSDRLNRYLRAVLFFLLGALVVLDLILIFILFNFISFPILLAGLIIFLIYILSMIVRPAGNLFWIPMGVFVVVLTVWMIGPVASRFVKINLPVEVSPTYSLSWQVAKESLKSSAGGFMVGSGPATYGYDFSLYRPQDFNANQLYNLRFYQGTGMFFEYLSTIGALGTFAFLVLVLSFISFTVYLLSREKEKNKIYSLGILSAAFIILLNAVLGRVEGGMLILAVLLCSLAVATVLHEGETEERYLDLSLKASPKFALTLAFVFMVISAGVVFMFVYLGKMVAAEVQMGSIGREKKISESSATAASKALGLYNKEGRYYMQLGQVFMVLANEEMLKEQGVRDVNRIQVYLGNAIKSSEAGRDLISNDVATVESLAYIYENSGFYVNNSLASAEDVYKRALELEPYNPNFYLKLGQLKEALAVSKKDEAEKKQLIGEAKELFQKSIELKKDFAPGYYDLALAQEALGELDGAIGSMLSAAQLKNREINYVFNLGRLFQLRGQNNDNQIAESLFKQVLGINSKEVNSHFYLALIYEKTDKKDEAIKEYQAVLDLLPADNQATRDKIQGMIDNLKSGIENIPDEQPQEEDAPVVSE